MAWQCAQLKLERIVVVGHSMGGVVAAHLTAGASDLVSAVVFLDSTLMLPADRLAAMRTLADALRGPNFRAALRPDARPASSSGDRFVTAGQFEPGRLLEKFDAVVGRSVLMYSADSRGSALGPPATSYRRALGHAEAAQSVEGSTTTPPNVPVGEKDGAVGDASGNRGAPQASGEPSVSPYAQGL